MWITLAATHHIFRDKMYLQTGDICPRWLPWFFLIIFHSHRCFQTNIHSLQTFSDILLILPPLQFLQKFHHHYHGDRRILADGMWVCHLECCYCFTTILGRRPWSDYPQHCLRMHLHHLLLDTCQPHAMPTIWRCFIWMCHLYKLLE